MAFARFRPGKPGHRSIRTTAPRRLRCEPLEDRRMLSVAGLSETIEVFHAQDALFAENVGQWADEEIAFGYNKGGTEIFFSDDSIEFNLSQREAAEKGETEYPLGTDFSMPNQEFVDEGGSYTSIHFSLHFDNARSTEPTGSDQADTVFNYHIGDPIAWLDGVATYKTIIYPGLYDGIDLHTFSRHGQMKYEFHVQPGADYSQISLSYAGIEGLSIDSDGALRITTALGDLVDDGLYIYQTLDGQTVEIPGHFTLVDADTYTFTLAGDYDPTAELVIDPYLDWGTYVGGSQTEYGEDIALDSSGNIFMAGTTNTYGWTSGGYDESKGLKSDAFVVKLSPGGAHLWSTYLGGEYEDEGLCIAVDPSGDVFVGGQTILLTGDPVSHWVSGGYDTIMDGPYDAFVAKLSSDGAHLWSTFLGGSYMDYCNDIAIDSLGNAVVSGMSGGIESDWVSGGYDTSYGGNNDAFVVKISPDGSHLWSTYIGDYHTDSWCYVAVDASDNILASGQTISAGWTSGGPDVTHNGGFDVFVVKLSPNGAHLWSTYLGGSDDESVGAIALDGSGNILLAGRTASDDWISGGYDTSHNGGTYDAFVAKLSPEGEHLWSTCLGGDKNDYGHIIAVDPLGNVLAGGHTYSRKWTSGGFDTDFGGGDYDGFMVSLSPSGKHLWSTYLGGWWGDTCSGIAMDTSGNFVVTGRTGTFQSSFMGDDEDNPIIGGYNTDSSGDCYVIRFTSSPRLPGDADDNGTVDAADARIMGHHWLKQAGATWDQGDFNRDGRVNGLDGMILAERWSVPEPVIAEAWRVGPRRLEGTGLLAPVRTELGSYFESQPVVEGAGLVPPDARELAHDLALAEVFWRGSTDKIISPARRKLGAFQRPAVDLALMEA
ncbi:MAG: SBBP repeat-containing protein [Pirellulales bacterium]|nr:SBBP repeat-containing protein [Pirellulales bacterium]